MKKALILFLYVVCVIACFALLPEIIPNYQDGMLRRTLYSVILPFAIYCFAFGIIYFPAMIFASGVTESKKDGKEGFLWKTAYGTGAIILVAFSVMCWNSIYELAVHGVWIFE